jgi:hypothetical protein
MKRKFISPSHSSHIPDSFTPYLSTFSPAEISPSFINPSFPPSIDIRASITRSLTDDRPTPRPRGTGKLLSSTQGVGLALLRLEHVDGASRGELRLGFEFEEGNGAEEMVTRKWGVTSWWPDWWPTRVEAG